MLDVWARAWRATSVREANRNSLARYGYTRRREQSEGRSGLYHGNGVSCKAASPVPLFETRPSDFEHLGSGRTGHARPLHRALVGARHASPSRRMPSATAAAPAASQSLAPTEGTTVRKLAILEPLLVYAMIVAYIWNLRYSHGGAWAGILGLMLLSHLVRREDAWWLGLRARNMGECWREFAPALTFLTLLMLACGILLHTMRPIGVETALASWAAYVPWGVFQQYVLNGYFLNRFRAVLGRRAASLISAALFCGVHTPNWFLMVVAFPAGYCSTRIYCRHRNLYFLGLAHATVGFLIFLVVPDSLSHHLNVGPGWFGH